MNPEQLLLDSLRDLERIAAFVCRKGALPHGDVEDFTSFVKLRLIENDYAILRKFEQRSSLRTYLSVVVHRLLSDYRNHLLGKWRPSAEAKRLGEVAVLFETLTHRDRMPFDEAVWFIASRHPEVTREALQEIASQLPRRPPQRREIALEELPRDPALPAESIERDAEADAAETLAARTAAVVRRAIDAMPGPDRILLRMRFEAEMSVAEIARAMRVESAPLYRRIYRCLGTLRTQLERSGVHASDVERLVGTDSLDFGMSLVPPEPPPARDKEIQAG